MNELLQEDDVWMCHTCYEKQHFFSEIKKIPSQPSSLLPHLPHEGTKTYICGNCTYTLRRESVDRDAVCPYCGDRGTIRFVS